MTVTTPSRGSDLEHGPGLEQRVADLEALIEEARRRARRRRRLYVALALGALGAGAWAASGIGGGGPSLGPPAAASAPASAATHVGTGRWASLHGPDGGDIFAIAVDPTDSKIVYAGGWGNVFKSSDGGARWADVTDEPWTEVGALAVDPVNPGTVYAGTDRGIAKTTDGGRNWRMVNAGLFTGERLPPLTSALAESVVDSLTVDARHPATVYATTPRGLYRTTNGGKRWQVIGPASLRNKVCWRCAVLRTGYWMSFAIDPDNAGTIYGSWTRGTAPGTLYESTDGGTSWRQIAMSAPHSFVFVALTRSGTLLGTDVRRRGVYRSSDGGVTWSPSGLPGQTIGALDLDRPGGAIYATTADETVFKTTDDGVTWQTVPATLAFRTVVTDPADPATSYASAADGLVKSSDHGFTWTAIDKGLASTTIATLTLAGGSPGKLYAGTTGGVWMSSDRGRTWHSRAAGLRDASVSTIAVDSRHPRRILAGTYRSGLFESADGGLRWRRIPLGVPAEAAAAIPAVATDPQNPDTVYVVACHAGCEGAGVVLKTVDGGASWRHAATVPGTVEVLAVAPQHASTVFAGTTQGGIFRSTDGGRSWHGVASAPGAANSHLTSPNAIGVIAIDPLDSDTIYAANRTGGILKSADGGATWLASNSGLTNRRIDALVIDPRDPRVLVTSTEGGVFRSMDGGESWRPLNRGMPAGGVASLAFAPAGDTVFAGSNGNGVLALRLAR